MQNSNQLYKLITTALIGVIKQIKAIRYYPPRHPALKATAEESLRGFKPILAEGNHLSLVVRKEGFLFDDNPVAKGNQVLSQLSSFCFARRIQHLTFLADLNSSDLHHFVNYLLLDPYGDPRINVCIGDSGGPSLELDSQLQNSVVAVTVFGDEPCVDGSAGVLRVDPYLTWIGSYTIPCIDDSPCVPAAEIFIDGFERGDPSRWTQSAP